MTGDPHAWEEQLKAVPLTGSVALLLRDEGQAPPIGTRVSFTFEGGVLASLQTDPRGEWQITRRERVEHAGTVATAIVITRVILRSQGPG